MAKKTVYYWRGPGELLGCKAGEKVPTSKMDKKQLAKMIKDGRIQETAFDIAEDTGVVAELKVQVKTLSEQIVELNKSDDKAKIAELEGTVSELEADIASLNDGECEPCKESATKITELEEDLEEKAGVIVEYEAKVIELETLLEAATADSASGD